MKMTKRSALLLAALSLGWGRVGHTSIERWAIDFLPAAMDRFIADSTYFALHASDADNRKFKDPTEGPKHFIDLETYRDPVHLSANLDSVITLYGAQAVNTQGILPWAEQRTYDSLVALLRRGAWTEAESVACDLGHYVGDSFQPLHCTVNYDGQLTGNAGIHARYETEMLTIYQNALRRAPHSCVRIARVFDFCLAVVLESHTLVDTILASDRLAKSASAWDGTGTAPGAYYAALWNACGTLTNLQIQKAASATADLWYSAWAEAGLPLSIGPATHGSLSGPFRLLQSYPNPCNPSSTISYTLSASAQVRLVVYTLSGAPVRTLVDGLQGPGNHQVRFDASALSSGVYFYRVQSGALAETGKLVVLR